MVMRRNAMRKNLRQSILKSFGRYVAILAIIALGSALFVGLLMTKTDMVETGQVFYTQQNMFDIRLVSTYGWEQAQVDAAAQLDGIEDAEGVFYTDLICNLDGNEDDSVFRFYTIPEKLNLVALRGGRMPERPNECLIDGFVADDSILGKTITIQDNNDEDALDAMAYKTYTIVGYIASPLYSDINRGTTSVGNGKLETYLYVPQNGVDADYFTEIHLTIPGNYDIHTEKYHDVLDDMVDAIEPDAKRLVKQRFDNVKAEAEKEYADGVREYEDGVKEYEDGVKELEEAELELKDAEEEIKKAEQKLVDGEKELHDAYDTLEENRVTYENNYATFQHTKAQKLPQLQAQEASLTQQYNTVLPLWSALNTEIQTISGQITALKGKEPLTDEESATLQGLEATLAQKQADPLLVQMAGINAGLTAIQNGKAELAAYENELANGKAQLDAGYAKVEEGLQEIRNGWEIVYVLRDQLEDGWEEYEDGKQELEDAEIELADAKIELADAREEIDSMEPAEVFVLDRTSNIGYNSLDSASDIVAGVSRVFPVFFLLVAALVCITTMTRMIDEERTQIGTLKALGYSNGAIINKYLMYAGSGAVIGCGLGVLVGSVVFPNILWNAYKIMLYIQPDLVIVYNWTLLGIVVSVYTAVMLVVTWYCCKKTLQEVPAELIRPKAPDPGKKIILEYLPFWHKISFLNKVTIRNIFRYRQRLAMMLVGIGGCTALLVTGFGLRDSVVNVVNYQFEDVTTYDLEVYFNEGLSEKQQIHFLNELPDSAASTLIYHQSSVEVDNGNGVKEIYMISADTNLQDYIDLHSKDTSIPMPGVGEMVLSVGTAEALEIEVGDTVTLRNPDLQAMELTVSGIYENHVYNYCIVLPETIESQWGELPEQQMAMIQMTQDGHAHQLAAAITEMDNVMNVSVSEDLASMVARLMQALDLVVVVAVVCAALLAVIVLYNLTNININERIREIATIKVLGFNASETAAYVFKENLVLTVVGSGVGLLMGKLLLDFVMSQIKIDMVWFKAQVLPQSYIWAIVITILSACFVNLIFYFKLDTINMAEAMKSVE